MKTALDLGWGQRASNHAQQITNLSPGRGSATDGETRAAVYISHQLETLQIGDAQTQTFIGLRSIWLFVAMAFGFALVGHAGYWLLRPALGDLPALAAFTLGFGWSAYLLWRKFTFQEVPLRRALPHGPSQNVIAKQSPSGPPLRKIVLIAHLDSHRAVWWYAHDKLVALYNILAPAGVYGVFIAPLLYAFAELFRLDIFAWLATPLTLLHFLAWFTGVTADLGPYSPGANDNASALGTVLTLAERLKNQPLQHTEVWMVFTGCEETGCDGMRHFLAENQTALSDALWIDFELVGIGEQIVYLQQEGLVRPRRIPIEVEKLLQQAGQEFHLQPNRSAVRGAFTETGVIWEAGLRGACLIALRSSSPHLPEWHRLTDTADRLQSTTLGRVHDLAWEILQRVDAL
jgi:hypothetical protein